MWNELLDCDGRILFAGFYSSYAKCLERAVMRGIPLPRLQAQNRDLRFVSLDGAILTGADFSDSDLTGANLSGIEADDIIFDDAVLIDACLCEARMSRASFIHTRLQGAIFVDAVMTDVMLSAATLQMFDFSGLQHISGMRIIDVDGRYCLINRPPVQLRHQGAYVTMTPTHTIVGNTIHDCINDLFVVTYQKITEIVRFHQVKPDHPAKESMCITSDNKKSVIGA